MHRPFTDRENYTGRINGYMEKDILKETDRKRTVVSHKELIERKGSTIASPVSGSMRPLVRPCRDCAVFVRPEEGKLRKYDIVLYMRGDRTIMHRIIGMRQEAFAEEPVYIIRGDNSCTKEYVPASRIFGRMTMLYRGERCIRCDTPAFRLLSRLLVKLNPLFRLYRRLRRRLRRRFQGA